MEQQEESCCLRVPACRVFLVALGTRMDDQFHTGRRKTEADNDDNLACQPPPDSTRSIT